MLAFEWKKSPEKKGWEPANWAQNFQTPPTSKVSKVLKNSQKPLAASESRARNESTSLVSIIWVLLSEYFLMASDEQKHGERRIADQEHLSLLFTKQKNLQKIRNHWFFCTYSNIIKIYKNCVFLPLINWSTSHLPHLIEVILLRQQKGVGVLGSNGSNSPKGCRKRRNLHRKVIECHYFRIGFDQLLS